jgi:hypothetical protein
VAVALSTYEEQEEEEEGKSACKALYKKMGIPLHHNIRSMKQKYFYEFKGLPCEKKSMRRKRKN